MGMKNIFSKAVGGLPVVSFCRYSYSREAMEIDNRIKFTTKSICHFVYAMGGMILAGNYIGGVSASRDWNPITQGQSVVARREAKRLEAERAQAVYDVKWNTLFGERGLADRDNDGIISFDEKADAFERMGLGDKISFPTPNVEDIEKGMKSYEKRK